MKWIFILFLMSFQSSWAGNSFGNGGDAVVCRDSQNQIIRAQLLDHYEFETMDGGTLEMGLDSSNEIEKVNYVLSRLSKVNPSRAYIYRQGLQNFYKEVVFTNDPLKDINDSGDTILPRDCQVEQLAIQNSCEPGSDYYSQICENREKVNYYDWSLARPRYLIHKPIWDKLDVQSKAGLILHELIYREASQLLQHSHSIYVRKINNFISSNQMHFVSQDDYNNYLNSQSFGTVDIDGIDQAVKSTYFVTKFWFWGILQKNTFEIYPNGVLKKAQARYNHDTEYVPLWVNNKRYVIHTNVYGAYLDEGGYQFDQQGRLQGLELSDLGEKEYPLKFNNRVYKVKSFKFTNTEYLKNYLSFYKIGNEKINFLKFDLNFGSETEKKYFGFHGVNLTSGTLDQDFEMQINQNKISIHKGSVIGSDDDHKYLRFAGLVSGQTQNIFWPLQVNLIRSSVTFDSDSQVIAAAVNETIKDSKLNGSIQLNSLIKRRFQHSFRIEYKEKARTRIVYLHRIDTPLACVFQNKKYFVKNEILLENSLLDTEALKIISSSDLPTQMKHDEFCLVEGN